MSRPRSASRRAPSGRRSPRQASRRSGKTAGRGLSPHTLRAYRTDIATFAIHLTGADPSDRQASARVTIADLTPASLTRALSSLQRAGAADKTRARLHGTKSGLSAYLIQQGALATDLLTAAGWNGPGLPGGCPATSR